VNIFLLHISHFFSDGGAIFLNSAASTSAALPTKAPGTEPLGAAEPFQQADENGRSTGYRAVSVENIPPTHTAQLEVSKEDRESTKLVQHFK
jgi:hypothetical protein